jgi:hypothetical protein
MPATPAGELELDLGPPASTVAPASEPTDPFGPSLEMDFAAAPPVQPAALDDPFGSALDPEPPPPQSQPPLARAAADLDVPRGSSSFTSDPVSVDAAVSIPAGRLSADLLEVSVPIEISLANAGQEILIPIRLQLKIRIT